MINLFKALLSQTLLRNNSTKKHHAKKNNQNNCDKKWFIAGVKE